MKILYLGPYSPLVDFLKTKGDLTTTENKTSPEFLSQFKWIFSYGYRHILTHNHIKSSQNPIINLHISYLPWNRGSNPNYWSWVNNTIKGVTIHYVDEGIDTGDIVLQKEVKFNSDETLFTSYNKLKKEIEKLFITNFENITKGIILPKPQPQGGSLHYKKDFPGVKSWDIKTKNLIKMTDLEIIDAVEAVRTKNNKNWMDVLRVAFKHAPEEARPILAEINKSDGEISRLLDKLANNK